MNSSTLARSISLHSSKESKGLSDRIDKLAAPPGTSSALDRRTLLAFPALAAGGCSGPKSAAMTASSYERACFGVANRAENARPESGGEDVKFSIRIKLLR